MNPFPHIHRLLPVLVATLAWNAPAAAQTETFKLKASDPLPGAAFGRTVALDGDVVLVGARNQGSSGPFFFDGKGATYVYRNTGSNWIEVQELLASDGFAGEWFGSSVALDGDLAVVGAVGDDDKGFASGSAYVFRFDGTAWIEEDKLLASDGKSQDEFGTSVSISGDVIVVGAPENNLTDNGRAYVFRFDGSGWVEEAELLASDGEAQDDFGIAVAVSGDVVAVGAWNEGNTGQSFPDGDGAVYVFRHDPATGLWNEEAKLVASAPLAGEQDRFGYSLSLSGEVLLVGTWPISFSNPVPSGSAYLFRHTGSGWVSEAKLVASDAEPGDDFGHAVSISGDLAVIGAWGEWSPSENCTQNPPLPGVCNAGSAYLFQDSGGGLWTERAKVTASDIAEGDDFAWSVGVSGDVAVMGAWRDADGGTDSGSAYLFAGLGDCNGNGMLDINDIDSGLSEDLNGNGVPDECEALGLIYCSPANPNSTGVSARILATGSDAVADNDFRLGAFQLPANQFGYFLASELQGFIAHPGASQGNLCLGGQIARFRQQIQNSGAKGEFTIQVDLTSIPTTPPQSVLVGQTWNFQAWFRDLNPGPTSNFTDGVSVTFS